MPENKQEKNGVKVLHVLEELLFLSKAPKKTGKDNISAAPDDIKNRILLKMERAEIMSAMMAMRGNVENEDKSDSLIKNKNSDES